MPKKIYTNEQLTNKVDNLTNKVDSLSNKVDKLETRIGNLETRFDNLETRFDNLEKDVEVLKSDMVTVKTNIRTILRLLKYKGRKPNDYLPVKAIRFVNKNMVIYRFDQLYGQDFFEMLFEFLEKNEQSNIEIEFHILKRVESHIAKKLKQYQNEIKQYQIRILECGRE